MEVKEYISIEAATEAVWEILNGLGYSQKHCDRLVEDVDAALEERTAADVRPVVKARWSEYEDELWGETIKSYCCSNCHHLIPRTTIIKRFCPNCGADMRGESDA